MSGQKSAAELNHIINELEIARIDAINAMAKFVSDSVDKAFDINRYRELQEKIATIDNQIESRKMMLEMR